MSTQRKNAETDRRETLRAMLRVLNAQTYERIKELRRDQEMESESTPGDEMDQARASVDVETHASLIARAEEKLRYLDEALTRLDKGAYGICARCHEPIPVERLVALPFAGYCVDCQTSRNAKAKAASWSEGGTIAPYDQQWDLPEEMQEAPEREYHSTAPEEELAIAAAPTRARRRAAKPKAVKAGSKQSRKR